MLSASYARGLIARALAVGGACGNSAACADTRDGAVDPVGGNASGGNPEEMLRGARRDRVPVAPAVATSGRDA